MKSFRSMKTVLKKKFSESQRFDPPDYLPHQVPRPVRPDN